MSSNRSEGYGEAPALLIHNVREHGWSVPGVAGYAELSECFADAWSGYTGQAYQIHLRERVFELTEVIAPRPGPGVMRMATQDDRELVLGWIKAFSEEALGETMSDEEALGWARNRIGDQTVFLWELPGGEIVSLAAQTRPVSQVISVAPVYTPPEHRGYGYASRCVAALSQHLLDSGWQRCSLFTDLANPTSNSIYQKIGYRPVCDFNQYTFV